MNAPSKLKVIIIFDDTIEEQARSQADKLNIILMSYDKLKKKGSRNILSPVVSSI